MRSPLLPFARLIEWQKAGDFSEACGRAGASEDWGARRARLGVSVREAFSGGALRDALFFASAGLERRFSNFSSSYDEPQKLERTLARYLARAAGRETPFGLFAGISLGRLGPEDCLELDGGLSYRGHAQVAFAYLNRLMATRAKKVRERIPHEPNSTLARVYRGFRFVAHEPAALDSSAPAGSSVLEVQSTRAVERTLEIARAGVTPAAIATRLHTPGLSREAVLSFVCTLCDRGLLVPAWFPTSEEEEPLGGAIAALAEHSELASEVELLRRVEARLREANETTIGQNAAICRNLQHDLDRVSGVSALRHCLQIDLIKPAAKLRLSQATAQRFLHAAEILQRTGAPPNDLELEQFKARFQARYADRCVSLVEALDPDLGVGFQQRDPSPRDALLDEIPFRRSLGDRRFDDYDQVRLELLARALATHARQIDLDREMLQRFPQRVHGALPESFGVLARLARGSEGGPLVVEPIVAGSSAANILARFCHADADLRDLLHQQVRREQELCPEALLADIVYLPDDDSANLLKRPVLREYEIPCGGRSVAPPHRQIRLEDLLVTVENEEVLLYSRTHNQQVKVRITNAHNFSLPQHLSIYRFLGTLQAQDDTLTSRWSWGALDDCPFLPRVTHEDVVLSLARWRFNGPTWTAIRAAPAPQAYVAIQALRAEHQLPRWLTWSHGDRRLIIDLENVLSVETWIDEVRQYSAVMIEELLPEPEGLMLSGPEGLFAGQFLVPFLRRQKDGAEAKVPGFRASPQAHRYSPGSEWLYLKVYAARSLLDSILISVCNLVAPRVGVEALRSWFYLPYSDPESHLRLRFFGDRRYLRATLLPELEAALVPLIDDGSVWRLQHDTYEQEVERYGGPRGMEISERLFWADSEATAQLIGIAEGDEELRWLLTILGIDRLMADLGLELEHKARVVESAADAYAAEFAVGVETRRAIGAKYRRYAARLAELLQEPPRSREQPLSAACAVLRVRSERIAPLGHELRRAAAAGELQRPVDALWPSYLHLHALRMLGVTARRHELVMYSFLRREYASRSMHHRGRGGASANAAP